MPCRCPLGGSVARLDGKYEHLKGARRAKPGVAVDGSARILLLFRTICWVFGYEECDILTAKIPMEPSSYVGIFDRLEKSEGQVYSRHRTEYLVSIRLLI